MLKCQTVRKPALFLLQLSSETSISFRPVYENKTLNYKMQLELGNGSGRVWFMFVSNLNGLRISWSKPNPFIKWVEKL